MNKLTILVLKSLRKIIYLSGLVRVKEYKTADNAFCNQEGNDLIFEMLSNHGGGDFACQNGGLLNCHRL